METLTAKDIKRITTLPVDSISRAGRNDASVMIARSKAQQQGPESSPRSFKAASGRGKKDCSVTNDVLEAEPFGLGAACDSGKREEICSSPRSHPEIEKRHAAAHEMFRRGVFAGILREAPSLVLVDDAMLTDDTREQAAMVALTPRRPPQQQQVPAIPTLALRDGALTNRQPAAAGTTTATSLAPVKPQALSARAHQNESSSFLSPTRFREQKKIQHPDVGHYRPKFNAVEHTNDKKTKIMPLPSPRSAREIDILRRRDQTVQDFRDSAEKVVHRKDEVLLRQREEAERMKTAEIHSDKRSDDDDDEVERKKGPPKPTRESTWAFKSKTPICPPGLGTAAPDVSYCTNVNDNGHSKGIVSPRGLVNFQKQTTRPTLYQPQDTPDARALPSTLNQQSPVRMAMQSPRKGTHTTTAGDDIPFYDTEASNAVIRLVPLISDFSKDSPRVERTRRDMPLTTSVEFVQNILRPDEKTIISPNFSTTAGRKEPPIHVNDLIYDVEQTLTQHRSSEAIVRKDAVGHQPLWFKQITDKCDYRPSLDSSRPKLMRNINIDQQTPRQPQMLQIMDTNYDAARADDFITKRVGGNPLIGSHLSREKRNRAMSPKVTKTDAVYTYGTNLFANKGPKGLNFDVQVDRESVFSGRGLPSKKWLSKNPPAPAPGTYNVK